MNLQLTASPRGTSKQERATIRNAGNIPAILYGHGITNQTLAIPRASFEKVYHQAGESTLLDLKLDNAKSVKALIQDVDRHPTTGAILHVDFYQVKMDEEITNDVPLIFTGESKAVKELGGVMVKNMDHLKVRCLPSNLPHEIIVDIESLVDFEAHITVADVHLPSGVEAFAKSDEIIALVEPPRSEEELKALDEKVEENVDAVAKVEKEKKLEDAEGTTEAAAPEEKAQK